MTHLHEYSFQQIHNKNLIKKPVFITIYFTQVLDLSETNWRSLYVGLPWR
jgi:hypothetical protein